jgi:hypothetical protein
MFVERVVLSMISPSKIAKSAIGAAIFAIIFSYLWPLLPKTGVFSSLSWQLQTAVVILCGLVVIGPGQVAYEIITDSGL